MPLRPRDDAPPEGIGFSRIYDVIAVALSPCPVRSAPATKRGDGALLSMSFDHGAGETFTHLIPTLVNLRRRSH